MNGGAWGFQEAEHVHPPLGGMHVLDGYLSGAHLCAVHTGPVGRLSGRVVGDVGKGWGPVSGRS